MSNRFEKAFLETVSSAVAFGDTTGAEATWPNSSDWYAKGFNMPGVMGDYVDPKKKKKKKKKIHIQRRNIKNSL